MNAPISAMPRTASILREMPRYAFFYREAAQSVLFYLAHDLAKEGSDIRSDPAMVADIIYAAIQLLDCADATEDATAAIEPGVER